MASKKELKQKVKAKIDGLTDAQLASLAKAFERREKLVNDQVKGRAQSRVDRLVVGLQELEKQIKDNPKHPNVDRWKIRCEEYRQSLRNFHEFNQETKPTGTPGVQVNVPMAQLGLLGSKTEVKAK